MSVALILNELSYKIWTSDEREAVDSIVSLSKALRNIKQIDDGCFVLSEVHIPSIMLGENSLRKYASNINSREEVLFLFSLANKAPFSLDQELHSVAQEHECLFEGAVAKGMVYCYLLNTILISFPSSIKWRQPSLVADVIRLTSEAGEPTLGSFQVSINNVSSVDNLEIHREYLTEHFRALPKDGLDAWSNRSSLFPKLRFLDRVEHDLAVFTAGQSGTIQVLRKLVEMQQDAANWRTDVSPTPQWSSYVTPESATRKQLAEFPDFDGIKRSYDWHYRYTPGAGRIHFRLRRELGLLEIAYIGSKL